MKGREKEFWNRKILRWERSRYSALAALNPFAWTVQSRMSRAVRELKDRIRASDRVLDLGCGSGILAAELARGLPEREFSYQGIDVSEVAIGAAEQRGLGARFGFRSGDVVLEPLPQADVSVFLGLTDWITPEQLGALFTRLRTESGARELLFSFTEGEKKMSIPAYRLYHRLIGSRGAKAEARCLSEARVIELLRQGGWEVRTILKGSRLDPGRVVGASR